MCKTSYTCTCVCTSPTYLAASQTPANTELSPRSKDPCPNACYALCLGLQCGGSPQEW